MLISSRFIVGGHSQNSIMRDRRFGQISPAVCEPFQYETRFRLDTVNLPAQISCPQPSTRPLFATKTGSDNINYHERDSPAEKAAGGRTIMTDRTREVVVVIIREVKLHRPCALKASEYTSNLPQSLYCIHRTENLTVSSSADVFQSRCSGQSE